MSHWIISIHLCESISLINANYTPNEIHAGAMPVHS